MGVLNLIKIYYEYTGKCHNVFPLQLLYANKKKKDQIDQIENRYTDGNIIPTTPMLT
jgi:hypothetical protein